LKGTELGGTVDQVESLIKKHDAFESLLVTQDAKVCYLYMFKQEYVFHSLTWILEVGSFCRVFLP